MRLNDDAINNKVALVLGASGGIGRAVAMHLASEGYDVALHGNGKSEEAVLLQNFLKSRHKDGRRFERYTMDFYTGEFDPKKLIKNVLHDYKRIDVMVNCAGVMGKTSFSHVSEKEFNHVLQINMKAPFLLSQQVFNHMLDRGEGVIVNLSSFVVRYGMGRNETVHYAMSKAALETMTFGLARIGGPKGVRCNCVAPGITDTVMQEGRDNMDERLKMNPLRRMATPSEIAESVMFCINNQYLNGETIRVTGGE